MPHEPKLTPRTASAWFPFVLMLAVLVLRVLGQHGFVKGLPNFSPLMALAFAGTIVIPRPLPWWSWVVILLGVDAASQGATMWQAANLPVIALTYQCYTVAALWAGRLRPVAGILDTLAGTLACGVFFYLSTNTFCWLHEPSYEKSPAGWVQALTIGSPGPWPTTLEFFRNSIIADMSGAVLLLAIYNAEALTRGLRALPWLGRTERRLRSA